MAPETLHDAISNEKTDVVNVYITLTSVMYEVSHITNWTYYAQWSFGVTCWEVFSFGRSPYPGIENQDILRRILNNQRLERPSLCPKML